MLVKSKIKHYPDGSKKVLVYNEVYLVETGEKKSGGGLADAKTPEEIAEEREQSKKSNMFRVRTKIKDYVLSNDFDMFWSLTFGDGFLIPKDVRVPKSLPVPPTIKACFLIPKDVRVPKSELYG